MEAEVSFPCSQGPATGVYPQPDEFSPHPDALFKLSIHTDLCYVRIMTLCIYISFCASIGMFIIHPSVSLCVYTHVYVYLPTYLPT